MKLVPNCIDALIDAIWYRNYQISSHIIVPLTAVWINNKVLKELSVQLA